MIATPSSTNGAKQTVAFSFLFIALTDMGFIVGFKKEKGTFCEKKK